MLKETPDSAEIVIVGGGVIGLSIAYHLAKLGRRDVLLLERNVLTSGTSWHAAGIVGPLRASLNLTRLAIYATELFAELEDETGQATGYRRTGGFWLAQTQARLCELRRIAVMGAMTGLEACMVETEGVADKAPFLAVDDLAGALWVADDGQVNPVDLCMAYAKGARAGGLRILERTAVTAVETGDGAVRAVITDSGARIRCDKLVNCAGAWARQVGDLAGVAVPLQAVEHMYLVTEPFAGLPDPVPVLRDLDGGIYVKGDAGRLVLGGFETDAKAWDAAGPGGAEEFLMLPEDWEQFEPFMSAGLRRVPGLESVGIQTFVNGPESFTPDTRQLMGEAPNCHNCFVAAGFNSIGIMSSAGVGRVMAQWVDAGEAPMDLWEVDIQRFDEAEAAPDFLAARVRESVANQFAMHWPFKQMQSGRGLRHTPLHDDLARRGAVFGAPAGWERPLWFAASAEEREVHYGYGAQAWWPMGSRECAALRDGVALIDLSPFGKFQIEGAEARAFLQRVCANDVAVAPGRLVYTQMLNGRGGIEADVTVARLGENAYRVIGGAPTRLRDLTRLRRLASERKRVSVEDLSGSEAVIAVMGPRARDLLYGLGATDLDSESFPFAALRALDLAGIPVLAFRVSFVGELGWELHVAADRAVALYAALRAAGEPLSLADAGLFAVEACRLEKGYRHWGHDMGPDDTPLEVGLGFAVAFEKPGGFIGREALLRQRESGPRRRLLLFRVEAERPLLLHDEPVYRDGRLVGRTTSGGLGFRTGQALCFATVEAAADESLAVLRRGAYEIDLAGERFALTPLTRPPYDPDGARMRG